MLMEKCKRFKIDVVVSRCTAQSVDWKNYHIDMVSLHEEEEEHNGR